MKGKDFLPCPFCGATPHIVMSKARQIFVQDNIPSYGCGHYEKIQHELARCPHGCAELMPHRWNTRTNVVANNVINPTSK